MSAEFHYIWNLKLYAFRSIWNRKSHRMPNSCFLLVIYRSPQTCSFWSVWIFQQKNAPKYLKEKKMCRRKCDLHRSRDKHWLCRCTVIWTLPIVQSRFLLLKRQQQQLMIELNVHCKEDKKNIDEEKRKIQNWNMQLTANQCTRTGFIWVFSWLWSTWDIDMIRISLAITKLNWCWMMLN